MTAKNYAETDIEVSWVLSNFALFLYFVPLIFSVTALTKIPLRDCLCNQESIYSMEILNSPTICL